MKRAMLVWMVVMLAGAVAWGQPERVEGRIVRVNPDGTFHVRMSSGELRAGDVLRVVREGRIVGECAIAAASRAEGEAALVGRVGDGVALSDTVVFLQHASSSRPSPGRDGWTEFTRIGGAFSVEAPPLIAVSGNLLTVDGVPVEVVSYVFVEPARREIYEVMYMDVPREASESGFVSHVFDQLGEELRASGQSHVKDVAVLGVHPIRWNGLDAVEADSRVTFDDGRVVKSALRRVIVGGRLYIVLAMGVDDRISSAAYRFLRSFRTTKSDPMRAQAIRSCRAGGTSSGT